MLNMSYQVIARKYRPKKFSEVIGQDSIVTTLKNSLILGRTAHAYLFCGSRGTGKTTLARLMAKALNCDKKSLDAEPCDNCPSCQAIASGRSLDVLEIDGASNRGIDDIRQINETVAYASSDGKWKIYIIDEVHMLTKEAFNALLKTLEEPPQGVKFFFATTEPEKVPETIVSRCQRFDLLRISEEQILKKLKNICSDFDKHLEETALRLLARRARGGLRDAESMLDQILSLPEDPITESSVAKYLGLPSTEFFFQLDEHCNKCNVAFAFHLTETHPDIDPLLFLEGLAEHYRILLGLRFDPKLLEKAEYEWLEPSIKQAYLHSSNIYTTDQCLFILEEIVNWLQKIGKSPYPRFALEILLMTILRSKKRVAIDTLLQKISLLEKQLNTPLPQNPPLDKENENPSKNITISPVSKTMTGSDEEAKTEPVKEPLPTALPNPNIRHETIMRFAAVELEGSIKKIN
jgi:DNA polymerase-3 subunit gamma/tau